MVDAEAIALVNKRVSDLYEYKTVAEAGIYFPSDYLWVFSLLVVLFTASAISRDEQAFAQDTPIGTPGTQVATQETPAAVENSDALRKAAQNPVASLISVPIQNNNNFNIGPYDRTQDILNIQPVIPINLNYN